MPDTTSEPEIVTVTEKEILELKSQYLPGSIMPRVITLAIEAMQLLERQTGSTIAAIEGLLADDESKKWIAPQIWNDLLSSRESIRKSTDLLRRYKGK